MRRWAFTGTFITIENRGECACKGCIWIGDRNFCVVKFICNIDDKGGFFIIREHANLPYEIIEPDAKYIGTSDTGEVYEQLIEVVDDEG